jgi:hypothetical protein
MSDGLSADASELRTEPGGRELGSAYPATLPRAVSAGERLGMIAVTRERLATSDRYLPAIPADTEPRYPG